MWWREPGERQYGLVTWDQGIAAVGHDSMVRVIRSGILVRDRPGVYVIAGVPWSRERDILSACLAGAAVASHRSAAWIERFPGAVSLRPEITTGPDVRVRLPGVKAHRSTHLPPEHITMIDGIPCTIPARTAVDMSAVLSDDSVERMINRAHDHNIVTYAEIVAVFNDVRRRGRRRVAHLAPILDRCLGVGEKSRSDGERWVRATIAKAGMRAPQQQIWVVANGNRYCIDVGYVPEKVGIEFQGQWAHADRRQALVEDSDRISELELAGWLMLPVTHATTASVLIDRVQRALAQRTSTSGHSGAHGAPACPEVGEGREDEGRGYGAGHGQ
ncbi:MAG: hypothetical protein QOE35_3732 [Actinomycetota bacterium]|jgi:hypothetical protein